MKWTLPSLSLTPLCRGGLIPWTLLVFPLPLAQLMFTLPPLLYLRHFFSNLVTQFVVACISNLVFFFSSSNFLSNLSERSFRSSSTSLICFSLNVSDVFGRFGMDYMYVMTALTSFYLSWIHNILLHWPLLVPVPVAFVFTKGELDFLL